MKKSIAKVSDHAVIRYLEKVRGVDIESIRREIGSRVDAALNRGDPETILPPACGVILEGYEFRMADGVVVTVVRLKTAKVKIARMREDG
ncbi:MAG: hypothetical protein GW948_02075 [Rhodobacterales bacterium]|nr:hypothetical protein [Rhodobacterales bacterium]